MSRRKLVFSLLVVALLTAGAWQLGQAAYQHQRDALISELATEVAQGNPNVAVHAVKQLARFDEHAARPLLEAAGGSRPRVAPAARWAIDDLLKHWREDAGAARRYERRLRQLATTLVQQVDGFSADAQVWAHELADGLLHATEELPVGQRLVVVRCCEITLQATREAAEQGAGSAVAAQFPNRSAVAELPFARTPAPKNDRLAQLKALPLANDAAANSAAATAEDDAPWSALPVLGETDDYAPAPQRHLREANPMRSAPLTPAAEQRGSWQPQWTEVDRLEMARRSLPTSDAPAEQRDTSLPPNVAERLALELAELQPRELLVRLVSAPTTEKPVVQHEFVRRGLGSMPVQLATHLVSDDVRQRARAVQQVTRTPGVRGRTWISMLCDDPAADVRLAAVTLLATADDAELLEKAWQTVLNDRDPRFAQLVEPLREKRDSLRR